MKTNKYTASAVMDIDGCLADFEKEACDAFGYKNRHLYDFHQRYPQYDPDMISEWVNSEENYVDLFPIFGGVLLFQQLKQRGFYTILMTSRGEHLRSVTEAWLKLYNLEPDELRFSKDKADDIRVWNNQIKSMPITLFVDDSVSQLTTAKKWNPEVTCLAWSQPWNSEWFPRLRYNGVNFKVEANVGMGEWRWVWEK